MLGIPRRIRIIIFVGIVGIFGLVDLFIRPSHPISNGITTADGLHHHLSAAAQCNVATNEITKAQPLAQLSYSNFVSNGSELICRWNEQDSSQTVSLITKGEFNSISQIPSAQKVPFNAQAFHIPFLLAVEFDPDHYLKVEMQPSDDLSTEETIADAFHQATLTTWQQ